MPRGQKNKLRARVRRRQAQSESQGLQGAQATAAVEEESLSSHLPVCEGAPLSSPATGPPQKSPRTRSTGSPDANVSGSSSDEGAKSQGEEDPSSSQAPPSPESSRRDPLSKKAGMLVHFLLYKYKVKEPITEAEMLQVINKQYEE